MSVSTDAILCYGVNLQDHMPGEHIMWPPEWQDKDESETYYWNHTLSEWLFEHDEEFELVTHCSDSSPMHILAIRSLTTTASRGFPVETTGLNMDRRLESHAKLKAACERYNLPFSEPKWWLVSYWEA